MAKQRIEMQQVFKAPISDVFASLSDHELFGDIVSADIKRVVDSQSEEVNGLGSVRKINLFPAPAFEETITGFEKDSYIEYKITKGSPLKNHIGKLNFSENSGYTSLNYTIEFEPKYPIPLLGFVLKNGLEKTITKGLQKFAKKYN